MSKKRNLSVKVRNFLKKLANAVVADHEHYDQDVLYFNSNTNCGCLAYHSAVLQGGSQPQFERITTAAKNIAGDSAYKLDPLWLVHDYWPAKFRRSYKRAKTSKGRANAARNRVMHFIETDGVE